MIRRHHTVFAKSKQGKAEGYLLLLSKCVRTPQQWQNSIFPGRLFFRLNLWNGADFIGTVEKLPLVTREIGFMGACSF